jgi:hypothetical protein
MAVQEYTEAKDLQTIFDETQNFLQYWIRARNEAIEELYNLLNGEYDKFFELASPEHVGNLNYGDNVLSISLTAIYEPEGIELVLCRVDNIDHLLESLEMEAAIYTRFGKTQGNLTTVTHPNNDNSYEILAGSKELIQANNFMI